MSIRQRGRVHPYSHREGAFGADLSFPATPLIGRHKEMWVLRQQLRRPHVRVLTLTGPPGVGKTRLAVALASTVREEFNDGVVFVDLSSADAPSLVAREIARVLGVGEAEGILDRVRAHLASRNLLLVLDNFEHVLAAGPDVAEIAAGSVKVKILVTSRERLHIQWEHEFPVPPLEMPDPSQVQDLRRLAQVPAVSLFIERGQAVRPDFALSAFNAQAVADICMRLDGLPLAIELAAARVKVFPPRDLAGRLAHRMDLLRGGGRDVPPRHRTLRAAMAWSHDLLPPEERVLFRRLSVFVGGWTTESAEAVCSEPGLDVTEGIAALIDKSLVQQAPQADGTARFVMLESIREYALEALSAQGEREATLSRHAEYFALVADRSEAMIATSQENFARGWLRQEWRNLKAALDASTSNSDWSVALQLAAGLGWYWYTHGYVTEGRQALDRLLAAAGAVPPTVRASVVLPAGILAWSTGDLDRAELLLDETVSVTQVLGDARRLAMASAFLGHVARLRRELDEAVELHRRALALFEEGGNDRGIAWALYDLGLVARDRGSEDEAAQLFEASLERFRAIGYSWAVAWNCWNMGRLALRTDAVSRAVHLLIEAAELFRSARDSRGAALCLDELAEVCVHRADFQTAARLLAAAESLRDTVGAPLQGLERKGFEETRDQTRASLPQRDFTAAWQEGRSMTLDSAVEAAVSALQPESVRKSPLTPREEEVVGLIAEGSSNRAIAERLGIAERTVVSHIEHIMNKLAINSRAEIAAWAVRSGLDRQSSSRTFPS